MKCKHCDRSTTMTDDEARMAGWRRFKGQSLTGKPIDDVICPVCLGSKPDDKPFEWDVICTTCGWQLSDEWVSGDEPVGDAFDAQGVANDHRCEPNLRLKSPDGKFYEQSSVEFNELVQAARKRRREVG